MSTVARFRLHIWDAQKNRVLVAATKATRQDLEVTSDEPRWQTDWSSDYITSSGFDLYTFKTFTGELVALGAYEVRDGKLGVHLVYMEGQAESNLTIVEIPKYRGIGRALIAFGIKLSVDAGFNGDVTLDAKTPELARHYERDFGAVRIPGRDSSAAPRYLICDESAQMIFIDYLEE